MDVLNNIWNILTTENPILTKSIIATIGGLIELYLNFLLFTSILKISYTKKQKMYYIVIIFIDSIITNLAIPTPYNIFINYIIILITIKLTFKLNITNSILSIIIPTFIYAIFGTLILKPLLLIFNVTAEQAQSIPIYEIMYLTMMYLLVYCFIKLINHYDFSLSFKEDFDKPNLKTVVSSLVSGIFMLSLQLVITTFYTDVLPAIITFLNFISLILYFFISFYSLTKTIKLQITSKELENAENYNNTLSYLYDNVKSFKHDFNNMIFMIGGFIDDNDIDGLKKYHTDLEKDCKRVNNIEILNPQIINNPGIYNLIVAKYNKAEHEKVKISLEFFFDFDRLNMPMYEFSRILGILLDNSIEAASSCDEKQVNCMFRDSSLQRTQIIKIENTYSNKDVDVNKIFEKGVSEKKEHMGIGLWEVNQILRRINNIKIVTTKNEKYFIQQLEIYY